MPGLLVWGNIEVKCSDSTFSAKYVISQDLCCHLNGTSWALSLTVRQVSDQWSPPFGFSLNSCHFYLCVVIFHQIHAAQSSGNSLQIFFLLPEQIHWPCSCLPSPSVLEVTPSNHRWNTRNRLAKVQSSLNTKSPKPQEITNLNSVRVQSLCLVSFKISLLLGRPTCANFLGCAYISKNGIKEYDDFLDISHYPPPPC